MVLRVQAMTASPPARAAGQEAALPRPPALNDRPDAALFLDFDGTLVEIATRPDAIRVAQGLPGLLERLATRLDGRLAVVSGRALADLDRFLGPLPIAMAGSHGGEFREAGARAAHPLADPFPDATLASLNMLADRLGGLLVEPKPFSAAIHYRDREDIAARLHEETESLAGAAGLNLKRGKMVVELVMPGSDKGSAVDRFMTMPQFAGSHPLFAGDDVTDEDAFAVVRDHGGGGILVGPPRETTARWRLDSVEDMHEWLEGALA